MADAEAPSYADRTSEMSGEKMRKVTRVDRPSGTNIK
jgi:hypothetical protein